MGGGSEQAGPTWVFPQRSWGFHLHTRLPAEGVSARKRSPHNSWLWKTVGLLTEWNRGLLEYKMFLLKGPCTGFLRLTDTKIQRRSSSSEGAWDTWGGTEWHIFRVWTGEAAFCQTDIWREDGTKSESLSTWLMFIQPWWFPETLSHLTFILTLNCFQCPFYTNSLSQIML